MALALVCTAAVALFAVFGGAGEPAAAVGAATKSEAEPLVRSDPGVEPWREDPVAFVDDEAEGPEPEPAESRPRQTPEPESDGQEPMEQPAMEVEQPPEPTADDIRSAQEPRHYELPDGAVL